MLRCRFLLVSLFFLMGACAGGNSQPPVPSPDAAPPTRELNCNDSLDNDNDTFVDCEDSDCVGDISCPPEICNDGLDNDSDTLIDCFDPDCDRIVGCEYGTEATCDDTLDNDGDTVADCLDTDCDTLAGCEFATELTCDDTLDNDGDTFADCLDPQCDGISACEFAIELTCEDFLDNDGDTLTDCEDSDCNGVSLCELGAEVTCNDSFDNDGDTLIDCLDTDCNGVTGCEFATELTCDDGLDNDGDMFTDCADPDCQNRLACAVPACPPGAARVEIAATDTPIPILDNSTATSLISVVEPGSVLFAAVAVDITHTWDSDMILSLIPPGAPAILLSNRRGGSGDNYTGTIFSDLAATLISAGFAPFTGVFRPEQPVLSAMGLPAAGTWSLAVADVLGGFTGTLHNFTLVLCVCDGACEAICDDGLDDDADTFTDCADPDCVNFPTCP